MYTYYFFYYYYFFFKFVYHIGAGVIRTSSSLIAPTKTPSRLDETYEFDISGSLHGFIDLQGISLYVKGRIIRLNDLDEVQTLVKVKELS